MPPGIVETLPAPAASPIRRFADAGIQASVDRAVAQIPEGKHLAVVAYTNTDKESRFAVVARLGSDWSVVGVLEHRPGEKWRGEAGAVWTPF